jgi:hypothetical protein
MNSNQKNEGEGNKTAARRYNEATTDFTKSGQVEPKAQEAKKATEGKKRDALRKAEAEGRSHAKGEDPALKR